MQGFISVSIDPQDATRIVLDAVNGSGKATITMNAHEASEVILLLLQKIERTRGRDLDTRLPGRVG